MIEGKDSIRSIVSTGHGRLHLVTAACAIKKAGVDVTLIQGWMPKRTPAWVIDLIGRSAGSKRLSASMRKRRPPELSDHDLKSCGYSEFICQALFKLSSWGVLNHWNAAALGWQAYGSSSRKYIRDADVFHVRSGAGQGGAICRARSEGMITIADQSAAHPAEVYNVLAGRYHSDGLSLKIDPNGKFWRENVLGDCQEADYVLANSEYVVQTFVDNGYPASKFRIVRQGVRTDFIGLKSSWYTASPLRLLFTGSFCIHKGATVLLEAMCRLASRGLACQLNVFGNVESGSKSVARGLSTVEGVICNGRVPQEELREALANSDIYVFPSFAEGCASSVMEAMAAGLPVVTTANSGAPIRDHENGLLVPIGDPDALAAAISELVHDEEKRRLLGKAAADTIRSKYTWDHYGKNMKALYESLLGSSR